MSRDLRKEMEHDEKERKKALEETSRVADVAHPEADRPAAVESGGSRAATILVVDDSADMRSLLSDVLEHSGYRVLTAASGMRALGIMGDERPDLVITDLLMPGMSGFSFRSAMLRRPDLAEVPVIVLSAYWRRPGETLEAVEVLTKPLNIDRLVAAVSRLLAGGAEPPMPSPASTGWPQPV